VTGNHEYYGAQNLTRREKYLRDALAGNKNIHFLQCDSVEISGVRFLGCTGWSRMLCFGKDRRNKVKKVVKESVNDFIEIDYKDGKFTPEDCVKLGEEHFNWLDEELSKPTKCNKTVVVTHFAPSLKVANPKFPVDEISAYFNSGFDSLIEKHQPDLWAFGHNHANFDINIGETRVISNQRGYGKECADTYLSNFMIEV